MTFEQLLRWAKDGDEWAFEQIYMLYRPLFLKKAIDQNGLDEDLYQEFCKTLFLCIHRFEI